MVNGVAGLECIWLTVEYGGVGHYQKSWNTGLLTRTGRK